MDNEGQAKREYQNWQMLMADVTEAELDYVGLKSRTTRTVDMIQHFDDQYPPSHLFFPTVMRTY